MRGASRAQQPRLRPPCGPMARARRARLPGHALRAGRPSPRPSRGRRRRPPRSSPVPPGNGRSLARFHVLRLSRRRCPRRRRVAEPGRFAEGGVEITWAGRAGPAATMAPPKTRRKRKTKKPLRRSLRGFRPDRIRLGELDQSRRDAIGLGLIAAGAFFAFVFYFGWDGGRVGHILAQGLRVVFGDVAYLAPLALLAGG